VREVAIVGVIPLVPVEFRLLGDVEVRADGRLVDVGHARQRCVLVVLLVEANRVVSVDQLLDRVWADRPPQRARRALSGYLSRLRQVLAAAGDVAITRQPEGYVLRVDPMAVDLHRFHDLTVQARAGDGDAAALFERALGLWRGDAFAALDTPWVNAVRDGLHAERFAAELDRNDLALNRGRHTELLAGLSTGAVAHPLDERLAGQLLLALYRCGRQADALERYEQLRLRLDEELGADPSPPLRRLHTAILRQDPALDWHAAVSERQHREQPVVVPAGPLAAVEVPEVRYTRSGRLSLAYQVVGSGPLDVVLVPGWVSNVELCWREPRMAAFLYRVARSSRLILFDKRGTGLSDPVPVDAPPSLEERMDDVRAVMDAAGSERAALLGFSEGGAMSVLFAATYPGRTAGLLLWGTWCRQLRDESFPMGWTREEGMRRFVRPIQQHGVVSAEWFAPSAAGEPAFQQWFAQYARHSASPGMAIALLRANASMDVRDVLPSIRVPTIVLHRTDDILVEVGQGRYLAEHIPGARIVEFAGRDHWPWIGDSEPILTEITAFLGTVAAPGRHSQQVLTTVVSLSAPDLLAPGVVAVVAEHRGVLIDHTPHAMLARFDGPGRAVNCALKLLRSQPHSAHAGVHAGEVTLDGDQVHGPAVEIAREVATRANPSEVLVTRTVTDLVAGSSLGFRPRGEHHLASVGKVWALMRAEPP
jgi:DNA-binding SARP family transcriptional activator/pimeloyl-ACP methyl ester carboxylesterase